MIVSAVVSPAPEFCLSLFTDPEAGCLSRCVIHKLDFLVVCGMIILLPIQCVQSNSSNDAVPL